VVETFNELIYNIGIIVDFNWGAWDGGRQILRNLNFDYNSIDIPTKCKLITAISRNDRFCEGALASEFKNGNILKILKSIDLQLG
jgi:hypothetical protein